MNRERFFNLELLHLHLYRRTDFNQIIWKGYIHGYTHRIFLIVKRINFMEPIGTILDSNIWNFVSRWYSNLVKTINQRNNRFEWGQFKNNYLVKYCDRFYFIYQIESKLKFIYSNDTCMINLFHVRIFLDHRVKSRWAMWPVIFFLAHTFSLIPDEWRRGENWIAFFFLRIPFRCHHLDTVDDDFDVSNRNNRKEHLLN